MDPLIMLAIHNDKNNYGYPVVLHDNGSSKYCNPVHDRYAWMLFITDHHGRIQPPRLSREDDYTLTDKYCVTNPSKQEEQMPSTGP
jgi:hypothetical protein